MRDTLVNCLLSGGGGGGGSSGGGGGGVSRLVLLLRVGVLVPAARVHVGGLASSQVIVMLHLYRLPRPADLTAQVVEDLGGGRRGGGGGGDGLCGGSWCWWYISCWCCWG